MPNKNATKSARPAAPSERQALSRDRLRKAGGRVVTIRLTAEDAKDLDFAVNIMKVSTTEVIGHAIKKLAASLET